VGFSLVAAFSIIGVSMFIALQIFTGSLLPSMTESGESYDTMVERNINRIQTDINISSVTTRANKSNYDHNFTVKNSGSVTLNISKFTVLINGVYQSYNYTEKYLYPEKKTNVTVDNLPGNGEKRLKIITENGISDYYNYTI